MRRHEEVERRFPHRHRDAAMRARMSDGARDVDVRDDLPNFQRRDAFPHAHLKRRSVECERQFETAQTLSEVRAHLIARFAQ